MKNKADLGAIYWADLLKSQKIIDTLFHSGAIGKLVVPNDVVSSRQTRLLALANDVTLLPCRLSTMELFREGEGPLRIPNAASA